MSRYNACPMCKHGSTAIGIPKFWCDKTNRRVSIFEDTSKCKDFVKSNDEK